MRDLINSIGGIITYDRKQPSMFMPSQDIHYIYFTLMGEEYIYSVLLANPHSYMLTKNQYQMLYMGRDKAKCEEAIRKLGKCN